MLISRRWLVSGATLGGLGWLLGCDEETEGGTSSGSCGAPTGDQIGQAAFAPPVTQPLDTKTGVGWDARLYHDLSKLDDDSLVTQNELFYIRTEFPDLLDESVPWAIQMHGLVAQPMTLSMSDIDALVAPQGVHVLECSGNSDGGAFGLISAADWSGAPLLDVLGLASVDLAATRVLVSGFDQHSVPSEGGHSTPGASWIFTLDEIAGAFLATHMNGAVLPKDHGFPVRLLNPGWYGCCCIKWVNEIVLVDESEPATSQMIEFASRTHQNGTPQLARDYLAATMDQAAMPVRVEKWLDQGAIVYRLVGIMWGGAVPTDALTISFDGGASYTPVNVCSKPTTVETWTLWSHLWHPPAPGRYRVRMGISDPSIRTRRLDLGWYDREIEIDEV